MTRFLESSATRWSLPVLAAALFAIGNLPWQLDDYDQAKQAFTSFEMVERGHWFYQHTPNWWVATKPPLVGWISAGLYALTRSWELAWRLPSFLAALALLVLLMRAASIYGTIAALTAGCALSFNLFTPRLASLVRTDLPLALVIFAIGWLIWEKIRSSRRGVFQNAHSPDGGLETAAPWSWTTRDRVLLFLLLSAGMLIKGPIVYAFLLPGLVLFEWRNRRSDVRVLNQTGWLPWLLSFLVFLVWVAGGILFVPEFTEHVVLREFAGRFSEEVHRSQPFYFYLPHLLHRFAPWSLLLIGFGAVAWKNRRDGSTESRAPISAETSWLLAWSLGGLLVMSFVPSKRIDRIFPIVPPLCLLLAAVIGRFRQSVKWRPIVDRTCAIAIIVAALGITGYTARKAFIASREHQDAFAAFGRAVLKETEAHHWRYAVVGRDDEGMLLYARKTEFLNSGQAESDWNAGRLDALVVPEDKIDELRLQPEPRKVLTSGPAGRYQKRYFLLAR